MYERCSKLPIKKPERRQWSRSGGFIVSFEHILQLVLFLLLTLNMQMLIGKEIKQNWTETNLLNF